LKQAGLAVEPSAPRREPLRHRRARTPARRAAPSASAAAVHAAATAHVGAIDAIWLSGAALAALGVAFAGHERRQPALIELTVEGLAAFDRSGRTLFEGRIVGFTQWAERLLVLAVAGSGGRRPTAFVVAADAVDAEAFRVLAVRGRHAAH
jgi:hypothetical protein